MGDRVSWLRTIRAQRAHEATNRLRADIYIVDDVSHPGQRVQWCAFLAGRPLCTVEYVRSGGETGVVLQYKASVANRRQIWISEAFKLKHVELYAIISTLGKAVGRKWISIDDGAVFMDLATRRAAAGRPGEVVGFVTNAEKRSEDSEISNSKAHNHTNINLSTKLVRFIE